MLVHEEASFNGFFISEGVPAPSYRCPHAFQFFDHSRNSGRRRNVGAFAAGVRVSFFQVEMAVLAVLDGRVLRSGYGFPFLSSLKNMPVTHRLKDIRQFFDRIEAVRGSISLLLESR